MIVDILITRSQSLILFCIACMLATLPAHADPRSTIHNLPTRAMASEVNKNSVGIVFTHEHLYYQIMHNIEDQLEIGSDIRVVPVMGKSHVQSVYDLLYLRGVDLALLRADAIEYVKRNGDFPTIQNVVRSLMKISDEKIIILARNEFESIHDLAGQSVGVSNPGTGGFVTGSILFETLGIDVKLQQEKDAVSLEKIKSGDLAAMVYLLSPEDAVAYGTLDTRKRVRNLKTIDNIHILPLPQNDELLSIYQPTVLTNEVFPGMIAENTEIDSYSVDAILAAYKWRKDSPRYQKLSRFVGALIDNLDELEGRNYMSAWDQIDLDHVTPNVAPLALVNAHIATREQAALDLVANEKKRIAAEKEAVAAEKAVAEAAEKADKIAELVKQRDELTTRLGDTIGNADSEELELLLGRLESLLEKYDNTEAAAEEN